MTDAAYNCIDVIATARCAALMEQREPECALDHAMLGPALGIALGGVPIEKSRIAQVQADITVQAAKLKARFLEIAPDTVWPKSSLRPSTVALTKVFSDLGVRTRFGRNDSPTLALDVLKEIARDPRTPKAAMPLVKIVLALTDLEADRRALDLIGSAATIHNVPLLGGEWSSSGLWTDQPDFMRPCTQALVRVPEGRQLKFLEVDCWPAIWNHFIRAKCAPVSCVFDGKRKKDAKIKVSLDGPAMLMAPTVAAFARDHGITRKQAEEAMNAFHAGNPALAVWQEGVLAKIRDERVIFNPFHRTRRCFGRTWEDGYLRECLGWLIDSTCFDIAHMIVYHFWRNVPEMRVYAHAGKRILVSAPQGMKMPRFTFAGTPVTLKEIA